MQNRCRKRQQYHSSGRASKQFADAVRKGTAGALVFMLCFVMAFAVPANAAEKGRQHHMDTYDYCLRVSNVTVGMSELQGLDNGQKQALVERTSGYAFYKWLVPYREWGDAVSVSGDFGSVDWNSAGTYNIVVRLPSLTPDVSSEISYTLTIIDDLPDEPEPVPPVMYRFTVRFLEEETGNSLKDDYVSEKIEEGAPFTISEDILLPPEEYETVEIQGELEGTMTSDRLISVICRKIGTVPDEPVDPIEPENPDKTDDPDPKDPEEGKTDDPVDPEKPENQEKEEEGKKDESSGKNSGKSSGSGKGKGSGKSGSSSSSGNKAGTGKTTNTPAAPAAAAAAADMQVDDLMEESPDTEAGAVSESKLPAEEMQVPAEEAAEESPEAEAQSRETALAKPENNRTDESDLGGAVLPQADMKKEKYPMWSLTLGAAEGGVLAVLGAMILSDLKVIMWFEEKKKR